MEFTFKAGHPGLDFVNTAFLELSERSQVERIGDGGAFVAWLVEASLIDRASATALKRRFGNEALDGVAADARKLRQWACDWIARWHVAPRADYGSEVRRINRALERASWYHQLAFEDGRLKLAQRFRLESTEDLLALLLLQVALLVTQEEPELVKRCAGADCVLWFVDRTKAHRRLFCSAAVCGNRAKVAAFRARQRAT
ncbi:MAG TPA: CGNR zinc finger domain-containing protein [Polyangiaceae bacterium]